jgi:hypothetical protein
MKPTGEYNGWRNWQTWNVALWIGNDESLYRLALTVKGAPDPYAEFQAVLGPGIAGFRFGRDSRAYLQVRETPDGARWADETIDTAAINEMMRGL